MYEFNEQEWEEKVRQPLWYLEVPEVMKKLIEIKSQYPNDFSRIKKQIYTFFDRQLEQSNVALGEVIKNFDEERKDIDTIIIHHTHADSGMTKEELSTMELLRLYAPYFANPTYEQDLMIKGKPIYSGHFRNNKQVFYPYHWMVNKDGSVERLLEDKEIGWHSGDWQTNCRSVAISLNSNYENSTPSRLELEVITNLIKEKYPHVIADRILGHREVNIKTTCPSELFLSTNTNKGWKEELLSMI